MSLNASGLIHTEKKRLLRIFPTTKYNILHLQNYIRLTKNDIQNNLKDKFQSDSLEQTSISVSGCDILLPLLELDSFSLLTSSFGNV